MMAAGCVTTVVIVDDHHLFRAGLVELLDGMPDFAVVGEGSSGLDAITLAHSCCPDVVLLDVELPGPAPVTTIRRIVESETRTKVVILTMHEDPDLVIELISAGASGYLRKSAGRLELVAAISAAQRGEDAVVVSVSRETLLGMGAVSSERRQGVLSTREIEVLNRLAAGGSNRDIATDLFISEATVKRHLANIYAKLQASSRIDALRKAARIGLIPDTLTS